MTMKELALNLILLLNLGCVGVVLGQDIHEVDSTTSVIIILGFIGVLLVLSGIGIACSYLCYRRSQEQLRQRTHELSRGVPPVLSSLEAKPLSRGIPNWYGPSPQTPPMTSNSWGGRVQLLHAHTQAYSHPPTP